MFRTAPLVAEKGIGPGAVPGIWVDSVAMPGGQVSKRVLGGGEVRF